MKTNPTQCFTKKNEFGFALFGGPEEIRTLDLSDANRTLSQLSYRPITILILHHPERIVNIGFLFIEKLKLSPENLLFAQGLNDSLCVESYHKFFVCRNNVNLNF